MAASRLFRLSSISATSQLQLPAATMTAVEGIAVGLTKGHPVKKLEKKTRPVHGKGVRRSKPWVLSTSDAARI